jgi:hypothetical protein
MILIDDWDFPPEARLKYTVRFGGLRSTFAMLTSMTIKADVVGCKGISRRYFEAILNG